MKTCLSIAGSDCSGGAGIQADIKTFSAHLCFGMSVVTSVVAENTSRVISIFNVGEDSIRDQIDAVFEDIAVGGVKVGMLANAGVMRTVAERLAFYGPEFTVVDPVMVAKGGQALMEEESLEALKREIVPLAYLLTPNIPEAEALTGQKITDFTQMRAAAEKIYSLGAKNVLVKGGHLAGEPVDILFDGRDFHSFAGKRIESKNTHGTGCTLSSAITANLANGSILVKSVELAKKYVSDAILNAPGIGKGHGPTNHFHELQKFKGE